MERITYRIALDAHRTGIQRTLQGFETADKMARRIAINLVASGDTFEIPTANVVAMMYVTTPNATKPSVNACTIDGNTIICDVEAITEEGITELQLKVIETSTSGAKKVLIAPRFAVEVSESGTDDEKVEQTATFTALEEAIAKADAVYNSRVVSVEIKEDCTFVVHYADGTMYENDSLYEALRNGNALLAESWAVGGTGTREGEDIDNSKHYSNVSRSASEDANKMYAESHELMNESRRYCNYTHFQTNFETGELGYVSTNTKFTINKETGNLETDRNEAYTPEEVIASNVDAYIDKKSSEVDERISDMEEIVSKVENNNTDIKNLQNELTSTKKNVEQNIENISNLTGELQKIDGNVNQLSNPNLLINGDFQVWQRGDSFDFASIGTGGYLYTADRWCIFNSGRTITCNKAEEGLQFTCENNANALTQLLEKKLQVEESYVLSAKINGKVETLNIVGGTSVENEYLGYYITDVLGHDEFDRVIVKPQGTTTVSWVKLEKGSIATPFVPRLYTEELLWCQRYYYVLPYGQYILGVAGAGSFYLHSDWVSNNMRDAKTVTMESTSKTMYICTNGENKAANITDVLYAHNAILLIADISGGSPHSTAVYMWFGTSDKICIDAEIY